MNKEEKEAIEEVKRTIKNSQFCDSIGIGQIEILLNYIDKLQKENEELKEVHKEFATLCKELKTDNTLMSAKSVMEKVVSKDKIRTKIKELKEDEEFYREQDRMYEFESKIKMLKELLEDN